MRVIRERLFPPNHNNPCPTLTPKSAKVGKEVTQENSETTAIANEIENVEEHPHDEAKEARCVNRPGLNYGIGAPHDSH